MTTARKQAAIRRADAFQRRFPKTVERRYRRYIRRRLRLIERLARSEVEKIVDRHGTELDELARADAPDRIVREISRSLGGVRMAVEGQWSDAETRGDLEEIASQADRFEARQTGRQWKSVLGVDPFFSDEATAKAIQEFGAENLQLITNLERDVIAQLDDHLTNAARSGTHSEEFSKIVQDRLGVGRSRGDLIARDQIGSMSGRLSELRQRELGVTRYRWNTAGDERVVGTPGGEYPEATDPSMHGNHYERDGKVYSWDHQHEDGHPGRPIQCRCTPDPVIEDLL